MRFDIITIFPEIFNSYFSESIVKRAKEKKIIGISVHNLRDWTLDKHKTTDDAPYGGGAGMVMKIEPICRCVRSLKSKLRNPSRSRIILFSAKGKKYAQADARRLAKYDNLILICGRYEGVDERVAKHIADEEISIGNYVLTGGEIPAMILVDSISRLLPGVLGNPNSLTEESFSIAKNPLPKTDQPLAEKFSSEGGSASGGKIKNSVLEYPQYTKPEEFFPEGGPASGGQGWKVPKILLSGNHKQIEEWRAKNSKKSKG